MVDAVPDWARDDTATAQPAAEDSVPEWARTGPTPTAAPTAAPQPDMPGWGTALMHGMGAGFRHAAQAPAALAGTAPAPDAAQLPEAAPLEWGDVASPVSQLAPKLLYGLGEQAPTLAGGLIGGGIGGAAGPAGAIGGGALGAGLGAAVQSVAPYLADELRKTPQDRDGAWNRAMERASTSGVFSALGWALFPARLAQGPLKQLAFQILGVQPAVSVGEQATQNVIQGQPVDTNLGSAYVSGAAGSAVPLLGHAALKSAFGPREAVNTHRATDPVLSRLADPETSHGWIPNWNRLYTNIKDDLNPIREAENYLTEGQQLPAAQRPYILGRLTRGSYGKAEHMIDHATFDPITKQNTGMGLKQVLEPVKDSLDDFRKYMMSRRAIELHARNIETGIPLAEAQNTVRNNPQFAKPFQNWLKYHDNLLDYVVKSGIIGKDQANAMRELNRNYVPFYRLMEDPQSGPFGPGRGLGVRNPIYGIRGSERKILDPIESAVKNTYLFVSLADRNMALQALQKLAEQSPRGPEIMQKVKTPVRPITVTAKEAERAIPGIGHNQGPPLEDFTIFRPTPFRPSADEIAIFNNGKRSIYKVDPYLGAAVNGLDRESLGTLTKILAAPARLLRAGATLSPEFIGRNPVRDQFSAFVFSTLGRGYVPFYDFLKGVGQVFTKGEGYQNWLKSGGANSAMVSIDRNYVENLVNKLRDPSIYGTFKNVVRSPIDLLRAASEVMENATRIGENMRLLKRGESFETGGYGSREVTLDFQRIGAKMRGLNAAIAFLNAQMEGVDRAFRSIGEQPLGFAAKVGAAITLPSILLWWANKDDPRMQEIPRWEKDLFWIVPTDNWQPATPQQAQAVPKGYSRQLENGQWQINKGNIYRIPKPFELGVMFGSVPERILDAYYAKDPKAFKNVISSLWQAFMPNFVPQAALPVIEQFANRSLFTGRPLVPQYLEGLLPQQQANPYTTDSAKAVAGFLSKIPGMPDALQSPIIVENYIRAWTGGLGTHALQLADAALQGSGVAPTKVLPTLTNSDKTLIKAFAVRFPEAGANSIQDFYEESDKRTRVKKTVKYLAKHGSPEESRELIRNNVIATADRLKTAISRQMKMVRDAYNNPRWTPEQKRQFIDMSYFQAIKMAQIGNAMFAKTADTFEERKNQ